MKRKLLLLSTVGIAAGLVYAIESNRRKQSTANRESSSDLKSSANLPASTASGATGNDSGAPTELGTSRARSENGKATVLESEGQHQIDDQGTTQTEASHILKGIRDTAFDASNERLALALGRSTQEIEQWTSGNGLIDGDVLMKARSLAIQRGLEVE
jgi:hypothetical protein